MATIKGSTVCPVFKKAVSDGFGEAITFYTGERDTLPVFIAGNQTAAANKFIHLVGVAGTITDVRAYAGTAPTGATLIVDVHKNGTTIFTTQANRPTIAISGNASTTTAPEVTSVAAGDRLSIDVDQIGSTVAGADLSVTITIVRKAI